MNHRIEGRTTEAPEPAGPYSQSLRTGTIVTCSGQAGILPDGLVVDGIEAQCRQTLRNLQATLAAVGAGLHNVVQLRVYLTDLHQFDAMNTVCAEVLPKPHPARTTVFVTLPPGLLVEMDALAILDS